MLDKTTAAAATESSVRDIGRILVDTRQPLKARFRALFTLRNLGGPTAIDCIAACFADPSALLKHECAYCMGQMQDEGALGVLGGVLRDQQQDAIVRHEAGVANMFIFIVRQGSDGFVNRGKLLCMSVAR